MYKLLCNYFTATILAIILSVSSFIEGHKLLSYIEESHTITVSGRIYGKYVGQEHHRYYTEDNFNIAVHPYDSRYKDYSVIVDYSTFAKYNVGDNIAFDMSIYKVTDKNATYYNILYISILLITVVISCALLVVPFALVSYFNDKEIYHEIYG